MRECAHVSTCECTRRTPYAMRMSITRYVYNTFYACITWLQGSSAKELCVCVCVCVCNTHSVCVCVQHTLFVRVCAIHSLCVHRLIGEVPGAKDFFGCVCNTHSLCAWVKHTLYACITWFRRSSAEEDGRVGVVYNASPPSICWGSVRVYTSLACTKNVCTTSLFRDKNSFPRVWYTTQLPCEYAVHLCIHIHIHTHTHTHTQTYGCIYIYAHTYIHTYIYIYTYTYIYIYVCMYIYMCIYRYIYIHVYIYRYIYMYTCEYTCVYTNTRI